MKSGLWGGQREGAGRPVGATSAPPSAVVSVRLAVEVVATLEERAGGAPLGRYLAQLLGELAGAPARTVVRAVPAPPPPKKAKCAPEKPACGYEVQGAKCSLEAPLLVPGKGGSLRLERIPARYCVVEVDELLTSHNPLTGFGPRPGYPATAQERDYRLPAEQAKVYQIAAAYEPSLIFSTAPGALDGVPVVDETRIVLGGNGRTMATQLLYHGEGSLTPADLKGYLVENASQFGFDEKDVEAFQRPMIIRTIRSEKDARTLAAWSRRLNQSLSQQLDATRLAVSQARLVTPAVLESLQVGDEETLAEYLSSGRSLPFVRALQTAGILDARQTPQYLAAGQLTPAGRDLVGDLLVAVLVPDADQIQALGPGPVATLARSSPYLIGTRPLGRYSLERPVQRAVVDRIALRAAGMSLSEWTRQGGLFGGGGPTATDPLSLLFFKLFLATELKPVTLAKVTRRYLQLAKAPGLGQGGLFAGAELSPEEALEQATKEAGVKV